MDRTFAISPKVPIIECNGNIGNGNIALISGIIHNVGAGYITKEYILKRSICDKLWIKPLLDKSGIWFCIEIIEGTDDLRVSTINNKHLDLTVTQIFGVTLNNCDDIIDIIEPFKFIKSSDNICDPYSWWFSKNIKDEHKKNVICGSCGDESNILATMFGAPFAGCPKCLNFRHDVDKFIEELRQTDAILF